MKPTTLTAAILATIISTGAGAGAGCSGAYDLAETIMRNRQEGVPLKNMIEVIDDFEPGMKAAAKSLTMAAYGLPRFSTETNRQRSITDFASDVMRECMK